MRILQVCPHYVPAYQFGGPARVSHSLGRALVELSHEVHVCTTNLKSPAEDLDVPVDRPVDVDGIRVYYEPVILSRYWGFSPRLYRRVKREIAWADVVFVHFHYQFASWAGARIARQHEKPYVFFSHGSLNRWGGAGKSKLKKSIYIGLLERRNIQDALFIAFNAPEERELSLFSEKGRVVPSGIAPADFDDMPTSGYWLGKHPDLQGKVNYLYLGRLNFKQKGLNRLLPAFARLVCEREDVHLVLAGPDERGGEQQVRQLISELGIDENVTLTGMLRGADKLGVLQDCDAFVLPSPSEGLSIALLEAVYVGLPVLVTNRVGLCDEVREIEAGVGVPAEVESLYAGLSKLADESTRDSMRGRGKALILDKYTWDATACDLMAQIEELIT